jgi:hypothetical protein
LIANLSLEILNKIIALVSIARFDFTLCTPKKIVSPLAELRWREGEFLTDRI